MTIDFDAFEEMEFPPYSDMVYIFFYVRGEDTERVPFYVGETSRHVGRIGDYVSAKFSCPPDFTVGEAVKYLRKQGLRVVIKFKESHNRKADREAEEKLIIQDLHSTFRLLNKLKRYDHRSADPDHERLRIQQFIDQILENPHRNEQTAPAKRKLASGIAGSNSVRSPDQASGNANLSVPE